MSAVRTFRTIQFGAPRAPGATPQSLGIPPAAYPGRIATNADLIVAVDRQQTSLAAPLAAGDVLMTVVDPSLIVASNLLSIDNELVKTTGAPIGNTVPISRGFDGTAPATHLAGALVSGMVDAWHHNALVAEVEAIETALGPNLSAVGSGLVRSAAYDFIPQQPGGTLSVGSNVILINNPIPRGIGVGDTLYITGGTGTPEAATVTGWNPANGQAIVTCAFAHSGPWTIQSASAGIRQALNANAPNCEVHLPAGTTKIYGKTMLLPGCIIQGAGKYDPTFAGSEGTYLDASFVTAGYVFDYLSPVQATPYNLSSAFILRDFTLKTGLSGIRLNNDVIPTGANYEGYLTDGVVLENLYLIGGNQCASDPNANTVAIPTLATLKSFGVGINLTQGFRAQITGCNLFYFGVPIYIYGDENEVHSCQCAFSSIGIYLSGNDPNNPTGPGIFGNKNVIDHVKLGGFLRMGAIWQDTCGGSIIQNNYFELNPPQFQFIRVINSWKVHIGPGNWYQSPNAPVTVPSHYIQVSIEALIHDNDMLEGGDTVGPIQVDYSKYAQFYPNIVRMFGNGSYFPQPGNRSWQGGSNYTTFPQVPGILVLPRNTLLLNAYNNPSEFASVSTSYPWVIDPVTGRYALNDADASMNTNGFQVFFTQSGRRFRTFDLYVTARKTGTGQVFVQVTYIGNGSTSLFAAFLTFTTTTETSVQSTGNISIPATETMSGYFSVNVSPTQAFIEQVDLVQVS